MGMMAEEEEEDRHSVVGAGEAEEAVVMACVFDERGTTLLGLPPSLFPAGRLPVVSISANPMAPKPNRLLWRLFYVVLLCMFTYGIDLILA
jgi:hypothetical protein